MPAGGRLFAGLVFLLGELHASGHSMVCTRIVIHSVLSARRAHRIRDIGAEISAHACHSHRALDGPCTNPAFYSMTGILRYDREYCPQALLFWN